MKRSVFSIAASFVLFVLVTYGQSPNEHSTGPHSAIVEIHLSKRAYAPGEEIELSLILKSLGDGIYIAKSWEKQAGTFLVFG